MDYTVTQSKRTCGLGVVGPPPAEFKAGGAWTMGIRDTSIPDAPSPDKVWDLSPHGSERTPCITTHEEMRSPHLMKINIILQSYRQPPWVPVLRNYCRNKYYYREPTTASTPYRQVYGVL